MNERGSMLAQPLQRPPAGRVLLFLGLFLSSTGFNAAFASKRGVL